MPSSAGDRQGRQALSLLASCYGSDAEDGDSGDSDHGGGFRDGDDSEADRHGGGQAAGVLLGTRVDGGAAGGQREKADEAQRECAAAAAGEGAEPHPCQARKPRPTLFASLPPPRSGGPGGGASSRPLPLRGEEGKGLPSPTRKRKAKGPVKLVVPALSSADGGNDDETPRDAAAGDGAKRARGAGAGGASTLLALLPKAKNSAAASPAAATSMLPASVKAKRKVAAVDVPSATGETSVPPRETRAEQADTRDAASATSPGYGAVGLNHPEAGAGKAFWTATLCAVLLRGADAASSLAEPAEPAPEAAEDEPDGLEAEAESSPVYPSEYHQQYPAMPADPNQYYYHDPSQQYDAYAQAQDGHLYGQHYNVQGSGSHTGQSTVQVTGMRRGEKGPVQIQDVNVAHIMGSYNPIKDASLQAPKKG
ncbi:MAG: hypothetical protein BJ554DRAFT_2015, partial [Olpidium bornovanus]